MPTQNKDGLNLSRAEIREAFQDPHWATKFPPIMGIQQAAELLQLPVQTLYQMNSQGAFATSVQKVGKHLRFYRDRLVHAIFNDTPVSKDFES